VTIPTPLLLFQKMDRDEVRTYFENRKRKGFNCLRTQLRQAGTQERGTQAGQREFSLRMGTISGAEVAASWFNPRTGATTKAGTHKNSGTIAFDPPGVKANGNDWVLVLDDTATRFHAPAPARSTE
jgi:hypothetical protein